MDVDGYVTKIGYRIVLYHMTSSDEGMPVMLFYIVWLVSSIRTLVLFDGCLLLSIVGKVSS